MEVSSKSSGFFDWQSSKCELKDRFEYIFNKQLYCDVHFIVGPESKAEKISAHRLVLTAASVVFQTMFSEKWSDDRNEIEIPDAKPATFKELLKFIYSDKVSLTADTVTEIMYIAKKYSVRALELKCADFLEEKLCPENAFTLLIQARFFDVTKLTDACLKVIGDNTVDTLLTDDFYNIDAETLCLVLKRSDLIINEMELFQAVIKWSKAACEKQNLPVNSQNQRLVLKNAISFMRFPLMFPEDFATKVVESGLLLEKEIISVFLYIVKKTLCCQGFSTMPRRAFYTLSRFGREVSDKSFTGSNTHSIIFSPDRKIQLIGIGLYGSPSKPGKCIVTLNLKAEDRYSDSVSIQQSETYDCSKKIFRIMLKEPVKLTANTRYRFEIKIQGDYSFYGSDGKETISVNIPPDQKISFKFSNVKSYSYYSSSDEGKESFTHSGQIPEFLFRLL